MRWAALQKIRPKFNPSMYLKSNLPTLLYEELLCLTPLSLYVLTWAAAAAWGPKKCQCLTLTSRREKASLPSPWWVQLPVMEPMVKLGAILQLTLLWNGDSPLNTIRNLKFSHENKTRKITGFHLNTSYGIGCRGISSPATCVVRVRKIKIGPIFIIFRS